MDSAARPNQRRDFKKMIVLNSVQNSCSRHTLQNGIFRDGGGGGDEWGGAGIS